MKWYLAATCNESGGLIPDLYGGLRDSDCEIKINGLMDLLRVIANVIQILLRISSILAVIFIIIGGIMYITSIGDPSRTQRAKETITYAVIGLIISIAAYGIVAFVSRSFSA
jgi:hypothetical protein